MAFLLATESSRFIADGEVVQHQVPEDLQALMSALN
jgi:hypothetical protein